MKKTTLVAPYDDPLALAVAEEARALGRSVAALGPEARAGGTGARRKSREAAEAPEVGGAPGEQVIAWNPPSFVSARSAVLEAGVRFGSLDEAVLVVSGRPAPELASKPAEIEKALHDRFLSAVWLARELVAAFSGRGPDRTPGRLVIVAADRGLPPRDPLGSALFAALQAFASSLAESAQDAPYEVWAVLDSCPQDDLTAQYVSRILQASPERKGTRILRFTGKGGIFNRI